MPCATLMLYTQENDYCSCQKQVDEVGTMYVRAILHTMRSGGDGPLW